MMKQLRLTLVVAMLALVATASNAGAVTWTGPVRTFYAAGSSAQFYTLALAAGLDNAAGPSTPAPCGEHHWTHSSSLGSTGAQIHDPRGSGAPDEVGSVWAVWNDDFAAGLAGTATSAQQGTICVMVTIDSTVGVREYFARSTIVMNATSGFPISDGGIIPGLPIDSNGLPQIVSNYINGQVLNVGVTDIRPEDAKFATIRALTGIGTRVSRTSYTGAGYGPFYKGPAILSAYTSGKSAQPVDFVMAENEPDPFDSLTPRSYGVIDVGASPVMIVRNIAQTGAGHLGNAVYNNINRYVLRDVFSGQDTHIRQIATVSGQPDHPIHTWQRECLSGTFNTMEFDIMLNEESWPTLLSLNNIGQETGVNTADANCAAFPCAVESGNPFYHCGVAYGGACPGGGPATATSATRGRVIGTGDMINALVGTPDSIGYAFWGFSNFSGKAGIAYMTVDGIDPLFTTPTANPGTPYSFPTCAAIPCVSSSGVTLTNVANGSYPIWSVLRQVYDNTDPTNFYNGLVIYEQAAATNSFPDFLPFTSLQVFRSHFGQLISDVTYDGQVPNNGFVSGIPETGGDMGGAVLTVQSELDYYNDTGNQQVNERQ
jgi:ABC-type phosphate transport system substrate-binding protein